MIEHLGPINYIILNSSNYDCHYYSNLAHPLNCHSYHYLFSPYSIPPRQSAFGSSDLPTIPPKDRFDHPALLFVKPSFRKGCILHPNGTTFVRVIPITFSLDKIGAIIVLSSVANTAG